jgi:SAM-dependent methyltransferase
MSQQRSPAQQRPSSLFARIYERVAESAERRGAADHRRTLLAGVIGRVIEVGAGTGANFAHYPSGVAAVLALEPDPYLRERAASAAGRAPVPVEVLGGVGERLPAEAGSFDAGVASLVLCTVSDQPRALAELFRVIRPGGELRFYEHVLAERAAPALVQRLADATVWPRLAGGCHLARDTGAAIEQAGFRIETCERFSFSPAPMLPADPHILGVARRP